MVGNSSDRVEQRRLAAALWRKQQKGVWDPQTREEMGLDSYQVLGQPNPDYPASLALVTLYQGSSSVPQS